MSNTISGSKASLKLNGVKIAYASGVQVNREDTLLDVDVLDQLEVAEHAEVAHKASFTVNIFKVDANAATKFGFDPANLSDILSQPELTFEVYNRVSDKVECVITGVKRESSSGSLDARGVWTGSWSFKGRIINGI